jgi:hypothetical protein
MGLLYLFYELDNHTLHTDLHVALTNSFEQSPKLVTNQQKPSKRQSAETCFSRNFDASRYAGDAVLGCKTGTFSLGFKEPRMREYMKRGALFRDCARID